MLTPLLGSKNAERVLLFLLVNGSCYASELQKTFAIPLTPIHSILRKFEKANILIIDRHQKMKSYCFNPDYPLLQELKALLKTAFVHLLPEEKRRYFPPKATARISSKDTFKQKKQVAICLDLFWQRLQKVSQVTIQTQSAGQAFGSVLVTKEKTGELVFTEKGQWADQVPSEMQFSQTLRWTIDHSAGLISLEHLHYGKARPVFLFHLAPIGAKSLQSVDSHFCFQDCYFGRIEFNDQHIRFLWRILGPRKNEVLYHIYQ